MTELNWRDRTLPSHKCKVCGALWRLWQPEEMPGAGGYTWGLRSNACGQCCDNVAMGEQIAPLTWKDAEDFIKAQLAIEVMRAILEPTPPAAEQH